MNRRDVLTQSIAACGLCACGLGLSACAGFRTVGDTPPLTTTAIALQGRELRVELTKVPQLAEVGGSVKLIDHATAPPLIIARANDSTYIAASILCTHAGKEVEYKHEAQTFACVSQSVFAVDGTHRSGPAPSNLPIYETRVDGDTLVISLPA